jgi:hypothetical protein
LEEKSAQKQPLILAKQKKKPQNLVR